MGSGLVLHCGLLLYPWRVLRFGTEVARDVAACENFCQPRISIAGRWLAVLSYFDLERLSGDFNFHRLFLGLSSSGFWLFASQFGHIKLARVRLSDPWLQSRLSLAVTSTTAREGGQPG